MRVSSACWITGSPARAAAASAWCMIASPRIGLPSSLTATAPAALSEPYSVKRFAHAAAGGRGDGKDAGAGVALRALHPARGLHRIVDRNGVWHGADGGKSARRSRRGSGRDGLLVALPRLAQMDVDIDQPRRNDQARRFHDLARLPVWQRQPICRAAQRRRPGRLSAAGRGSHPPRRKDRPDVATANQDRAQTPPLFLQQASRCEAPTPWLNAGLPGVTRRCSMRQGPMNQCHADGDAVSYLLFDHRLRPIGHLAGDLEPADHRSRMHHDGLRCAGAQPLTVQLVAGSVLLQVDVHAGQPLLLDAQHHHNLCLLQRPIEVALDGDAGAQVPGLRRAAARAGRTGRRGHPAGAAAAHWSGPRGSAECRPIIVTVMP